VVSDLALIKRNLTFKRGGKQQRGEHRGRREPFENLSKSHDIKNIDAAGLCSSSCLLDSE